MANYAQSIKRDSPVWAKAKNGDKDAIDEIFNAYGRLVKYFAFKMVRDSSHVDDLVQEGSMGLLHAIQKFEPERGIQFTTYATNWIKGYIGRYQQEDRTIRVPPHAQDAVVQWARERKRLAAETGQEPDASAINAALGFTEREIGNILETERVLREPARLDAPVQTQSGDDEIKVSDSVPAPEHSVADALSAQEDAERVRAAVANLPEREAEIVSRRFGLRDNEKQGLEEVAAHLRISRERVRQIQEVAVGKLRTILSRGSGRTSFVARKLRDKYSEAELEKALTMIEPQNAEVIRLCYGIGGNGEIISSADLAKMRGVSLAQAGALRHRAMKWFWRALAGESTAHRQYEDVPEPGAEEVVSEEEQASARAPAPTSSNTCQTISIADNSPHVWGKWEPIVGGYQRARCLKCGLSFDITTLLTA